MSLEKIINIEEIILDLLISNELFEGFTLFSYKKMKIKSPTTITQYDYILKSVEKNRWVFFRIEDYFSYQKIILWVNILNDMRPVNLDVQAYFIVKLNKKAYKNINLFNVNTADDLRDSVRKYLAFVIEEKDDFLYDIFMGKAWLDSDFDWHNYK